MKLNINNRAFTLVELAIVIVIIGLLVAGVLAGQALIRQSQIQKITSAASSYTAALITFKGKYNCLSGDCANATKFFTDVTNGDGNSIIEATADEYLLSWKELALANLIKGSYSGTGTTMVTGTNSPVIYDNVTANVIGTAGFILGWNNTDGAGSNFLVFGIVEPTLHPRNWQPILETTEAFSIDSKLDDGLPGKGKIRVHTSQGSYRNSALCTNSTDANIATYTVANSGINCHILWLLSL